MGSETLFDARPFFESIHGDIYLWRIGELTAEEALEAIGEWIASVEKGDPGGNGNDPKRPGAASRDECAKLIGANVTPLLDNGSLPPDVAVLVAARRRHRGTPQGAIVNSRTTLPAHLFDPKTVEQRSALAASPEAECDG